eukprot:4525894-Alexandrium_andersonii.AAC.1
MPSSSPGLAGLACSAPSASGGPVGQEAFQLLGARRALRILRGLARGQGQGKRASGLAGAGGAN